MPLSSAFICLYSFLLSFTCLKTSQAYSIPSVHVTSGAKICNVILLHKWLSITHMIDELSCPSQSQLFHYLSFPRSKTFTVYSSCPYHRLRPTSRNQRAQPETIWSRLSNMGLQLRSYVIAKMRHWCRLIYRRYLLRAAQCFLVAVYEPKLYRRPN